MSTFVDATSVNVDLADDPISLTDALVDEPDYLTEELVDELDDFVLVENDANEKPNELIDGNAFVDDADDSFADTIENNIIQKDFNKLFGMLGTQVTFDDCKTGEKFIREFMKTHNMNRYDTKINHLGKKKHVTIIIETLNEDTKYETVKFIVYSYDGQVIDATMYNEKDINIIHLKIKVEYVENIRLITSEHDRFSRNASFTKFTDFDSLYKKTSYKYLIDLKPSNM